MPSLYLPVSRPDAERAPDRVAVVELGVDPGVLLLDLRALEDVVLALLGDRPMEVVAVGDVDRRADLVGRPFARTPVERLAGGDDVAHRPHRLLDRRVRVGSMAVQDVDEVEPEPLQRPVDRVHQVLAVERVVHVRGVLVQAPEHLGGHDVGPARPGEFAQHLAHDRLALAAGVRLGVVEEVAARVAGGSHALEGELVVELGVEGDPAAERQHAHLQPGVAEPAVFHVGIDVGGGHVGDPTHLRRG